MSEVEYVVKRSVVCDGGASSGHPRIYLYIQEKNHETVCPYCSKKFILSAKRRSEP